MILRKLIYLITFKFRWKFPLITLISVTLISGRTKKCLDTKTTESAFPDINDNAPAACETEIAQIQAES